MVTDLLKKLKVWIVSILRTAEYDPADNYYYIVILSAPVLLTVYRYFSEAQNFLSYFPGLKSEIHGEVYAYMLEYLSFFLLFLVVPTVILTSYKKADTLKTLFSLKCRGKYLAFAFLAILLIIIPSAIHASSLPSVLAEYPLPGALMHDQQMLPVYFLGLFFLYYLPWEFFFRGFLLFGLKDRYGATAAILIQTISSCLVHIGKPAPEIIGAIPFGIAFGIIALRTKNIWIVVLLHASLGIFTDIFIIYQG
ncbi:MAG: CPBP family intramembrane metalloprotease [Candidatus Sabulitectum sp.]|nr:CPBP family intramembrane metalloprotease [Candidatus Sabulitectum sp.]